MPTIQLNDFLAGFPFLNAEELDLLKEAVNPVVLPAGTILLEVGQTCRRYYYVESGLARGYSYTEKGEEITTWFWPEGDLIMSFASFDNQVPALETIEVIEEIKGYSMTYEQLQLLYDSSFGLQKLSRLLSEGAALRMGELSVILRTRSARARYEFFLQRYPGMITRLQLKQVAGFLGLTPETLSRVRAELKNG